MKQESFDYIWDHIVKYEVDAIFSDLSEKYGDRYGLKLRDTSKMKPVIFAEYERYRDIIRRVFFDSGVNNDNLIDLHKIGSCIIAAFSEYNLIQYDLHSDIPNEIFLSNYAIALVSGINTVYALRLWDLKKSGRTDEFEELSKQRGFYYPKTNPGHDEYLLGRIKALALNKANQVDFDLLAYADMLFWIDTANTGIIRVKLGLSRFE